MRVAILCGRQLGKFGWLAGEILNYLSASQSIKDLEVIPLFGDFSKKETWKGFDGRTIDCLINAVGYRGQESIKDCESIEGKEKSRYSNLMVAQEAVLFCREHDLEFIHISTVCVLDGYTVSLEKGFDENSIARMDDNGFFVGSVYGRHKWQAERYIFNNYLPQSVILRPHLPFNGSHNNANIIHRMRKFDQVYAMPQSMTYVPDLCGFIERCLMNLGDFCGQVFNVVNSPPLSLAQVAGYGRVLYPFHYDPKVIAELKPAIILNTDKISKHFELAQLEWAIEQAFLDYRENK